MTIRKELNGSSLVYQLEGRLDTNTAPELEKELKQDIVPITDLVFDLKDLDYISSAGLRVLLATQKIMNRQGKTRGLVCAMILIPWCIPTVVSGLMWNYIFAESYGVLNYLLQLTGLREQP